jgi:hypothetical protein
MIRQVMRMAMARRGARGRMTFYIGRVYVRSPEGVLCGYFPGCTAYSEDGESSVLLGQRLDPRLRRPFPIIALDPPTIGIDDPQSYRGFVPRTPMAA